MFPLLTIAGVFNSFAKFALSKFKPLATLPVLAPFLPALRALAEAGYRNLNVRLLGTDRRLWCSKNEDDRKRYNEGDLHGRSSWVLSTDNDWSATSFLKRALGYFLQKGWKSALTGVPLLPNLLLDR
jgi:hypothetical protein